MKEVRDLIKGHKTFAEAEEMYNSGQISQRAWDQYTNIWCWSASRYSGISGYKQDQYCKKFGYTRFLTRIFWVKSVIEGLENQEPLSKKLPKPA